MSLALILAAVPVWRAAAVASPRLDPHVITVRPPGAVSADPIGCPVTKSCAVRAVVDPDLRSALARTFPSAAILAADRTVGTDGVVYSRRIVARIDPNTVIEQTAQCRLAGQPVAVRAGYSARTHTDLSGNSATDEAWLVRVFPSVRAGCSAAVSADSVGEISVELGSAIADLAADTAGHTND